MFADNYGLIKRFPKQWVYGKDNTGDITNIDNIKEFKKVIPSDIDLMTSDCGLPWDGFGERELQMSFDNLAQISCILYNLPKGKNFILKTFLPQVEILNVSLNNLLYHLVDELYYYKPVQNPGSPEFYVIGKGYKGISDGMMNKLFGMLKKFDINESIIEIEEEFIKKYVYILGQLS